jgi:hypothetical protein
MGGYMSVSTVAALPAGDLALWLDGEQADLFGEWLDNVDDDESAKALKARVAKATGLGYVGITEYGLFALTYKGRMLVEGVAS